MIKKGEFVLDIHYFQRERKRMFDKEALNNWVMGINIQNTNFNEKINLTIEDIISSIAA
jgi:hypothetical protein